MCEVQASFICTSLSFSCVDHEFKMNFSKDKRYQLCFLYCYVNRNI